MSRRSDSFEILRDCRALFLKHLGALLLDSGIVSGSAIHAIQDGAGAYFDEMVTTSRRGSFTEEAHGLTASRITLVGEDDLELGIRLDNLSAKLFEATGGGLWKIHLRFVNLLRRPDLPTADNPVGPKGINQGLKAMFAAAGASGIEQKLALLDRIEDCLARNLPALYAEINDFLDRGGVAAAQPTIVTARTSPGERPGKTENALQALRQTLLAGGSDDHGALPGSAGSGGGAAASLLSQATLERLIFRLDELDRHGSFGPNVRTGTAPTPASLIPDLFSGDSAKSSSPTALSATELGIPSTASEGLAIDTLAMIFAAIFDDPKLPDALKAAISSLQITLLKVAMKDPSLFTDDQHPARQVLDRMGQAVLGLPTDVPARHPICTRLFEIASQLRSAYSGEMAVFHDAQAQLDALTKARNKELAAAANAYLPLLRQLDRRDEAAIQTRQTLDQLLERNPPDAIRVFLDQSWRRILQLVWLEHGPDSSQWQAHVTAIDELLWTFQPKTDPEQRKALARHLPAILKLLKAGMERIGLSAQAQEAFLDDCFALQTQALRAAPTADPEPLPKIAAAGLHAPPRKPMTGEVQSGQLVMTTLDFSDFQPGPARSLPCAVGDWLELQIDAGETRVARLCLISPKSQRALLLNPDFGLALAIHPAILDHRLRSGEARVVSANSLFEAAASLALQKTAS